MVLPDHECKPAALAALHVVVANHIHPDESQDVQKKMKAVSQATPGMGDLIALFRIWAPAIFNETCHHSLLLARLAAAFMKQRKGHDGRSLKLPFKHVLQDIANDANLGCSSSSVGEALAELMSEGVMSSSEGIRKLLPKLFNKEAGDVSRHPELLSLALQQANLDQLAAALKLPLAPAAKPEDPAGYYTGLLHDGLGEHATAPRSEASSSEGSMRSCLSDELGSPTISSPDVPRSDAQPASEAAANDHAPASDVRSEEDAASQLSIEEPSPSGQLSKKSAKNKKKKKKKLQQQQQQHQSHTVPKDQSPDDNLSPSEVESILMEIAALLPPAEVSHIERYNQHLDKVGRDSANLQREVMHPPEAVWKAFHLQDGDLWPQQQHLGSSDRVSGPLLLDPDQDDMNMGRSGSSSRSKESGRKQELNAMSNWPDTTRNAFPGEAESVTLTMHWRAPQHSKDTNINVPHRRPSSKKQPDKPEDICKPEELSGEWQPLRIKFRTNTDWNVDYLAAWFDPFRDEHLPLWAYPPPISPINRATNFPQISTFKVLSEDEQRSWLQIAREARGSSPDLHAEVKRLQRIAARDKDGLLYPFLKFSPAFFL
ncbi:hypothetical protein WJX84_010874 [Apatococcus fuscideae]|uniref:Uncharacterized protein n=1 Tax=Apatococcus fuscideae TaxID=2026836 RepID=A0AAW1TDM7_9CHLO